MCSSDLKHWKEIQHEYITIENSYNLIITLVNGKPCDDRNITKIYHRVCKEAKLNDLTIMKFKNYSQKQSKIDNQTNADMFYSSLDTELSLPKQRVGKLNTIKLNKSHFTDKVNDLLNKQDNSDIRLLLQQLKDNPELKMKLIEQLKAEL